MATSSMPKGGTLDGEIPEVLSGTRPERDPAAEKLAAAKQYLGENWMLHPNYKFRDRHTFSVARWAPHSILRPVQLAAQQAGRI